MKRPLVIVGAGGHAAVVADALLAAGEQLLGFTDPERGKHGRIVCGVPVLGDDSILETHTPATVALANGMGGVSSMAARRELQHRLQSRGWSFVSVRHPTAIVSPYARVADGAQLMAASVVQPGVEIGEGCIVNTAAVIEHDVRLGAWVHVAPRALICGDAVIGARCHIGAGAVVRQGVRLGDDTVVGAGAVVVKDFSGGGMLLGVPACLVERTT